LTFSEKTATTKRRKTSKNQTQTKRNLAEDSNDERIRNRCRMNGKKAAKKSAPGGKKSAKGTAAKTNTSQKARIIKYGKLEIIEIGGYSYLLPRKRFAGRLRRGPRGKHPLAQGLETGPQSHP